jgi:sterol 3beta-glucosyltransferase
VICPFFADQPFWGRRVHALGAGPMPIPQRQLSAERLAEAIITATSNPQIATAVAGLGARLRAERGVEDTVRWIERWLSAQAIPA